MKIQKWHFRMLLTLHVPFPEVIVVFLTLKKHTQTSTCQINVCSMFIEEQERKDHTKCANSEHKNRCKPLIKIKVEESLKRIKKCSSYFFLHFQLKLQIFLFFSTLNFSYIKRKAYSDRIVVEKRREKSIIIF